MAIISKPVTLTNGTVAQATDVESNFSTIYNDYNGNITNANIAAGAAIVDSKLSSITTYGKVNGSSVSSLASLSSAAGIIPTLNLEVTPWNDYSATSTIVGWSAFSTKELFTKKMGNTTFVSFFFSGTSNSTSVYFTLPNKSNSSHGIRTCGAGGFDNTTALTGPTYIFLDANSTTANVYKDLTTASWTSAGTKEIAGQFWYEAA